MRNVTAALYLITSGILCAQGPVIRTPTYQPTARVKIYPWKKHITATIFWIGEKPTPKNPTPNHASSWDTNWQKNFGGYDNPNDRAAVGYRPAAFIPKLNPFYIALPYNDRVNYKLVKPEASRVIPWFHPSKVHKGKSCLKGRWVQIVYQNRSCYAQWEDCGPFNTVDYQYVFGDKRPINPKNNGAGIDLSPSIRDYLRLKSGQKVHWRFVEASQVPNGPWKAYTKNGNESITEEYQRELSDLRRRLEREKRERLQRLDNAIQQKR